MKAMTIRLLPMLKTNYKNRLIAVLLVYSGLSHAADTVYLPQGERSFADEVVYFHEGQPAAVKNNNAPELALGASSRKQPALTLGCGGELVIRFTDNALVDVEGADLYIYEIGPQVEATAVAISENGRDWLAVGQVAGATASLDIQAWVKPDQSFSYVRLTDLKQSCRSSTPGADIDAIAAIGSAVRYQFSSAVLFDFDEFQLKSEAQKILLKWIDEFKVRPGRLQVHGHTDQMGGERYNLELSMNRAKSVADFPRRTLRRVSFEVKCVSVD